MSLPSLSPPSSPSVISSPTDSFTTSLWSPRSSEFSLTDDETSSRSSSVQAAASPGRVLKLTEYQCTLCGEIQTKRNKARHLKLQHKDYASSGTPEPDAKFYCPHCSKSFTRDDSCTRHIKNGVCKAPQAVIKQREAIKAQKKESKPPGRRASRKHKRKVVNKEIQQHIVVEEEKPLVHPAATNADELSVDGALQILSRLWEECGLAAEIPSYGFLEPLSLEPAGMPDLSFFDFEAYESGHSSADSLTIEDWIDNITFPGPVVEDKINSA